MGSFRSVPEAVGEARPEPDVALSRERLPRRPASTPAALLCMEDASLTRGDRAVFPFVTMLQFLLFYACHPLHLHRCTSCTCGGRAVSETCSPTSSDRPCGYASNAHARYAHIPVHTLTPRQAAGTKVRG